jgi:hypothetical protein
MRRTAAKRIGGAVVVCQMHSTTGEGIFAFWESMR